MIRDISNKSGGASVSILSNKDLEKHSKEILVKIQGDCESMKNAAMMIIEQIELFKHGGPVSLTISK